LFQSLDVLLKQNTIKRPFPAIVRPCLKKQNKEKEETFPNIKDLETKPMKPIDVCTSFKCNFKKQKQI
jgi:hypothetical protein